MKKKPIFMVTYVKGNIMAQPIKADDTEEAQRKFLKLFSTLTQDSIISAELLEPTHKHYRILSNGAK